MKRETRDNFSNSIIKTLERRVNAKCSNPDCRIPTSGPTTKSGKANNIGIAAHITAAASGGARYDQSITADQRSGIENAIWLCSNCATKIDKDAELYSVALLNEWKKTAEKHAGDELGKTPLSRENYSVLEANAFGNLKKKLLPVAVSRICNMAATAMEDLDPRFSVEVGYKSGATCYTLNPKEPVNMSLGINPGSETEFEKKYNDLIKHGRDLEIEAMAVNFIGSPLFELTEAIDGKLVLSTHARKQALLKLSFKNMNDEGIQQVDDITGEIVGGTESVTFKGTTFGGIIKIENTFFFDTDVKCECSIGIMIDLAPWYGRSIRTLPFFNKVYEFYDAIQRGNKLLMQVEIDGTRMISAGGILTTNNDLQKNYSLLRYLRNARVLLEHYQLDTNLDPKFCVKSDEVQFVEEICQTLETQMSSSNNKIADATVTLTMLPNASDDDLNQICNSPHEMRFEHEYDTALNLWGLIIERPRIHMTYTLASLKKLSPAGKIKAGKTFTFEVCPHEGCQFFADLIVGPKFSL